MKKTRLIKINKNTWIETKSKKPAEQLRKEFNEKYGVIENKFSPAMSKLAIFNQKG